MKWKFMVFVASFFANIIAVGELLGMTSNPLWFFVLPTILVLIWVYIWISKRDQGKIAVRPSVTVDFRANLADDGDQTSI